MNIRKVIPGLARILVLIPLHILYFFSGFVPKNPNLWVFGCWEGQKFRGNSKIFFKYTQKHPEVESLWITKNGGLYKKLKEEGIDVHYANSFQGILKQLRTKFFFVSHDICDVNQYLTRKSVIFDFSHATCPIKKMGYADPYSDYYNPSSIIKKVYYLLTNPYSYIKPSFAFTSSSFTANITKAIFDIDESKIVQTGLPKADFLLTKSNKDSEANKILCEVMGGIEYQNIILFLPTFRNDNNFNLFNFNFELAELEKILEASKSVLCFNLHPFDSKKVKKVNVQDAERIFFLNFTGDEVNFLLKKSAVLITDYGSIWADFLIFNRPILFANFDHSTYLKERELFLDYDNDLPGPKAKDWHELLMELGNILIHNNDKFALKRDEIRKRIYSFADGQSCSRIFHFVDNLVRK